MDAGLQRRQTLQMPDWYDDDAVQVKRVYSELLDMREERWTQARGGVADTLTELSEFYGSGGTGLSRRLADDSLAHWFAHLADQVCGKMIVSSSAGCYHTIDGKEHDKPAHRPSCRQGLACECIACCAQQTSWLRDWYTHVCMTNFGFVGLYVEHPSWPRTHCGGRGHWRRHWTGCTHVR